MTNEEAIKELKEDIGLYIPLHGTIDDIDRDLPDGRLITALEMAIKALEQQKTGKWMGIEYEGYADGNPVYDVYECSECGYIHNGESDTLSDYCPDCGARMEAESEESE